MVKNSTVSSNDEVERVRRLVFLKSMFLLLIHCLFFSSIDRAHQNDIENILVFMPIGFLFLMTNPNPVTAKNLFRAVGVARVAHTLSYAFGPVPQPTRAIAFGVAYLSTGYMAIKVIIHFWKNY